MISCKRYIVCTNQYSNFKLPLRVSKLACWCNKRCISMLRLSSFPSNSFEVSSRIPPPGDSGLPTHSTIAICVNGVLCAADCDKSLLTHSPRCLASRWVTLITYTTASTSKHRAINFIVHLWEREDGPAADYPVKQFLTNFCVYFIL